MHCWPIGTMAKITRDCNRLSHMEGEGKGRAYQGLPRHYDLIITIFLLDYPRWHKLTNREGVRYSLYPIPDFR